MDIAEDQDDHLDDPARRKAQRIRVGQLLRHMIRILADREHAFLAEVHGRLGAQLGVKPDTIYHWRRGISLPPSDAIAQLVEVGVNRAGMDRDWAEQVLALAGHPERRAILQALFRADVVPPALALRVRNNLPRQPDHAFVGRGAELEDLKTRLAPPRRTHIVAVEGLPGIGKTALALEVAWRYLTDYDRLPPDARFDVIVWVSAKREQLDSRGVMVRSPLAISSLDDLLRAIEAVMTREENKDRPLAERARHVDQLLRGPHRVLLIVDSLDALDRPPADAADDRDVSPTSPHRARSEGADGAEGAGAVEGENAPDGRAMSDILAFVRDLPMPHRAIITARFHEDLPDPICLGALEPAAMREFVQQEAVNRRLYLSAHQCSALVEASGGVPEVAWRDLSLMARSGLTVARATAPDNQEPLARPLLDDVFAALRGRLPGHRADVMRILLALAFFDERVGVRADVIHRVADVDPDLCRRALHLLGVLNLIRVSDAPGYDDETPVADSGPRYVTIPYVAEQAAAHLDAAMRHEVEMRARWVAYYLDFAEAHGRVRPTHSLDYDAIQREWPNLRKVFEWCATQPDAYERLKQFWLDDRVSTFADVRGYWEDRRRWLLRLADLAASRDDRDTDAVAAEATVQAAYATALLERYDEAAAELERARGWSEVAAPRLRGEIAVVWAMLTVRQRDFVAACRWLTDLKCSLTHDTLDAAVRRHLEIDLAYYQGRVFLLQGRTGNAEHAFQRMLALCEAQPGRWVRERAYALNALAEVALALGEAERAVPVLEAAFDVAADIKDRRLRASITRTRAALWRRQGQRQRARKLTHDAQNEFTELGMRQEAAEIATCVKALAGV